MDRLEVSEDGKKFRFYSTRTKSFSTEWMIREEILLSIRDDLQAELEATMSNYCDDFRYGWRNLEGQIIWKPETKEEDLC